MRVSGSVFREEGLGSRDECLGLRVLGMRVYLTCP